MRLIEAVGIGLFLWLCAGCAGAPGIRDPQRMKLPKGRVALRVEKPDGGMVTLGSLRGRIVLITVVTTWAETALLEVPRLKALARSSNPDDLAVVCIVLEENRDMVRIFSETFDLPYIVGTVEDPAEFTGDQGPLGPIGIIPTSVLLDREGRIRARMDGIWPEGLLEDAVGRLVAGDPTTH